MDTDSNATVNGASDITIRLADVSCMGPAPECVNNNSQSQIITNISPGAVYDLMEGQQGRPITQEMAEAVEEFVGGLN